MGEWRRVIHQGSQVVAVEHRGDEYQLGADAYTAENLLPAHAGFDWFTQDVGVFNDTEGVVPWEALSVNNSAAPPEQRTVIFDAAIRDTKRQEVKDRTRGAGGRLDVLEQNLDDDTITDSELRELLRLRGR